MPYYLHRATPIDHWKVYVLPPGQWPIARDGEVIELPDVQWFSQAQAEADRRNGKQDGGQGSLQI